MMAPMSPSPMTTFCTRANTLTPNTTKKKAMMLAMVAMTKEPHA